LPTIFATKKTLSLAFRIFYYQHIFCHYHEMPIFYQAQKEQPQIFRLKSALFSSLLSSIFILSLLLPKKGRFLPNLGVFSGNVGKTIAPPPAPFYLCTVSSRHARPTMAS